MTMYRNKKMFGRKFGPQTGGVAAGNVFSFVASDIQAAVSIGVTAGQAGDLIICGSKWENNGDASALFTGLTSNVDGALTMLSQTNNANNTNSEPHILIGYIIASNSSACNIARTGVVGTPAFPATFYLRVRPSVVATVVSDATGTFTSTIAGGSNVNFNTTNFTTATLNGVTVCFYAAYSSALLSNLTIGGNAATAISAQLSSDHSWAWFYLNSTQLIAANGAAQIATGGVSPTMMCASFNSQ